MKKLVSLLLAAVLALCAVLPALADSTPLMYKVTDAEGHVIYMLGTMHIVSSDTFPIAHLDEVMGKVDTVYFELDAAAMEQVATSGAEQQIEMVEDNGLSEEAIDLVEQFMLKYAGVEAVDRNALRQLSLNTLTQTVQGIAMASVASELSPVMVDAFVMGKAQEMGLKIQGVETLESQLSLYAKDNAAYFTESKEGADATAAAEKNLVEMLQHVDEIPGQLRALITAYKNGDKDALLTYLAAENTRSESDAGRNALYTNAALQVLKDGGNALFAIGVYHLIAEDGLVNTLTAAGCTVELIK